MDQSPKLPQEKIEDTIHRRLDEHDKNRIAVQSELDGVCKGLLEEIDKMEKGLSAEMGKAYEEEETRLQEAIQRKSSDTSTNNNGDNGEEEEFYTQEYEILKSDGEREVSKMITLRIEKTKTKRGNGSIESLQSLSEQHQESKETAAEALAAMCNEFREEVRVLKEHINSELEGKYTAEDKRLQDLLSGECDEETIRANLLVEQSYSLHEDVGAQGISARYTLSTRHSVYNIKEMKPRGFGIKEIKGGKIYLDSNLFSEKEREVLERFGILREVYAVASFHEKGRGGEYDPECRVNVDENSISPKFLRAEETYSIRIRIEHRGEKSLLSEGVEFTTPWVQGVLCMEKVP